MGDWMGLGRRPTRVGERRRTRQGEFGELAPSERTERLAAEFPESFLRRREFLARTAALAAIGGVAGIDTLVSQAAIRQTAKPFPSPRNMPIDTFVVLMMENRSFDHYFGWHPDADAKNAGLSYPDPAGTPVPTHHLPPDFQGCDHPDPAHGWDSGRHQLNHGRMDGFVQGDVAGTGSDEFAAGYYLKDDIGFLPLAADAFTLYDRWFCSILASTYPNRHYQVSAQNGGQKGNMFPFEGGPEPVGFQWETIFDRALARGVSVGYYVSDLPFPLLYGARANRWIRPVSQFYSDAAAGNLPQITFVDPPFRDGGGGNGVSADEHPHGDIRLGQAFMSDVAHAFIEGPQYARGTMFINYDEWGGFFDHVVPPRVPDQRSSARNLQENWGQAGFRVPAVALSPFTRNLGIQHMTCTHESILKLISYRFRLGYLNVRHRYASNVGRSFDFARPDPTPPTLPDPASIAAVPCGAGGSAARTGAFFGSSNDQIASEPSYAAAQAREAAAHPNRRPAPHHLVGMETSGLLERLGYEVQPASLDNIFRNPDRIRQALRDSEP